jgi:signal peptidase I
MSDVAERTQSSPSRPRVVRWTALLVLVLTVWVVRAAVVAPVRIDSASMEPTLDHGDVVMVTRRPPPVADLARGDLVVFRWHGEGPQTLKRVVGLGGDVVVVRDAALFVNHERVDEPYVDHALIDGYYSATFTVPEGSVFVLGDNRGNSLDSRDFGSVSGSDLVGRVLFRIWPVA